MLTALTIVLIVIFIYRFEKGQGKEGIFLPRILQILLICIMVIGGIDVCMIAMYITMHDAPAKLQKEEELKIAYDAEMEELLDSFSYNPKEDNHEKLEEFMKSYVSIHEKQEYCEEEIESYKIWIETKRGEKVAFLTYFGWKP